MLVFDDFCFHLLLLSSFQVPFVLGFLAHPLYRIHNVVLLRQKSIPEISRPLDVVGEPLNHVRQGSESLNTWVPRFFRNRIRKRFVFEVFVLYQPLLQLNKLERIRRSGEYLSQHRIGIKRDRRHQRIQLVRRNLTRLLVGRRARCLRLGSRVCQGVSRYENKSAQNHNERAQL